MTEADKTYVFTDVHGCRDALDQAIDFIDYDSHPGEFVRIIGLGDYVDRGPHSSGVIETLRALQKAVLDVRNLEIVLLRGNHEQMMCDALKPITRQALSFWLMNGGSQTLASYGISEGAALTGGHGRLQSDLRWMAALPTHFEDADRYYVHAGLQPGIAWEDQPDQARLWYRKQKGEPEISWPKRVVHGHTPMADGPEVTPERINLDTGCGFIGGRLTVAKFVKGNPDPKFACFIEGTHALPGPRP